MKEERTLSISFAMSLGIHHDLGLLTTASEGACGLVLPHRVLATAEGAQEPALSWELR
jgi:hypothetical protein